VNNATVHFDFELPLDAIKDRKLSVQVEPVDKNFVGASFPAKMMDNHRRCSPASASRMID
jgi:tyrosinase